MGKWVVSVSQVCLRSSTQTVDLARILICLLCYEDKDMGCCGGCGGEAPNHSNDQDKNKDKDKEVTSQPQEQEQDKEKK